MDKELEQKLNNFKAVLSNIGGAVVAFSGGVDSTLLLKIAVDVLGENVLAVTADSPTYASSEIEEAKKIAEKLGCRHNVIKSNELDDPRFVNNPPERCYYCKKMLFGHLMEVARENGLTAVLDGTNADDKGDFRPGRRAARELGVRSPFLEAQIGKEEIRKLSKELGLPTWDKPSYACLASRFPYGTTISMEQLTVLDEAEKFLRNLGLGQVRVRHHGTVARIEVPRQEMTLCLERADEISRALTELGYSYVALDLKGYRTGSMNETLAEEEKKSG